MGNQNKPKEEQKTPSTDPGGAREEPRLPAPERCDGGQGSQAPAYVGAPEIPEGQDQQVKENEESETPAEENTEPSEDRKSTRLNSSHSQISYAVFCLQK